jgi:hypothetical protein
MEQNNEIQYNEGNIKCYPASVSLDLNFYFIVIILEDSKIRSQAFKVSVKLLHYHFIYIAVTDYFYFADNVTGDLHDILELNINNALKSLSITEHDTYGLLQMINCSFAANSGVRSVYTFFF